MERRTYQIEERDAVLAQLLTEGKQYNDYTLEPDENGRYTNCYVEISDTLAFEPPLEDDTTALLAAADERILELEYENLILKEGLA